ncbi:MAG: DUF3302 domain-containing protein [Hyphomicrobiaceae bacterium]
MCTVLLLVMGAVMSGLDIFAILVLLILLCAAVVIWIALAMLPGRIAAQRNHTQAEAINIGGWLGAILGGVFWPVFLIWAFLKPLRVNTSPDEEELKALRERVGKLEAELAPRGGPAA